MIDVQLDSVNYGYDDSRVLNGISMSVSEGGLTCIIGPNGVGKSTLVKCMNRILTPDGGTVFVDGRDVQDYKLSELSKVMGFVPVASENDFALNVLETVLMGRHPHQHAGSRDEDIRICYRALSKVGMERFALRNANELSAGQQQRVAIAKGIAQEPKLLILDEPTANLDIRHQILVTKLLLDLTREKDLAVLMISHDLNIAAKYADRVIVMNRPGVVQAVGHPNDVITEDMIREVYGVESVIINDEGRPHVILHQALEYGETGTAPADQP